MKRLIALVLIAGLVASYSVTAGAAAGDLQGAAFNDIAGDPGEAALAALGALGVFSGSQGLGGPVDPDDPITREAYCKVVVEALGKGAQAHALMAMKPPGFSDADSIAPWFWGYVNVAVSSGIIKGYPDGTFGPKKNVSYAEALVMLVRCVENHEKQLNDALGWPSKVIFYAVPKGFSGDVTITDPNGACSRSDMARFLLATMQVDPLDATGATVAGGAILAEGGRLHTGKFFSASGGSLYLDSYPGPLALGDQVYLVGASTYDECVGINVECISKADGKIVFIERAAGNTVSGLYKTRSSDAGGSYIELKSGQKVYYSTAHVSAVLNDEDGHDETSLKADDELVINLDSNDKAVFISAKRWDLIGTIGITFGGGIPPMPILRFVPGAEDYLAAVTPSTSTTNTELTFPAVSSYQYNNGTLIGGALDGVILEVGASATVKINGLVSSRDSLKAGDVIRGRTYGADGYTGAASVIEIAATSTLIDGTVTSNRSVTDSSGTTYYVTVNVGGTEREYQRMPGYIPMEPTEDLRHKFSLDRQGRLFHEVLLGTSYYDVYVKSSMASGSQFYITVDNRGTQQQYETPADWSALVQTFCRIFIDDATGKCTSSWPVDPGDIVSGFNVMSANATSLTVQLSTPPNTTLFTNSSDTAVYKKVGSDWVYIGTGGLTSGDSVSIFAPGGYGLVFVFYEP